MSRPLAPVSVNLTSEQSERVAEIRAKYAAMADDLAAERAAELSPIDLEVLALAAEGFTCGEIAALTFKAYDTVRYHQRTTRGKLGAKSLAQSIVIALRLGLID